MPTLYFPATHTEHHSPQPQASTGFLRGSSARQRITGTAAMPPGSICTAKGESRPSKRRRRSPSSSSSRSAPSRADNECGRDDANDYHGDHGEPREPHGVPQHHHHHHQAVASFEQASSEPASTPAARLEAAKPAGRCGPASHLRASCIADFASSDSPHVVPSSLVLNGSNTSSQRDGSTSGGHGLAMGFGASSSSDVASSGFFAALTTMPTTTATTMQPLRTTAEVVTAMYGDVLNMETAVCQRLADQPAMREPSQRRRGQKLNLERRSNVEALLAHVSGVLVARACKNCAKGHGPWTACVVLDGLMCGSCTNCWYNASGARCTYHGALIPSSCLLSLLLLLPLPPPLLLLLPRRLPHHVAHTASAESNVQSLPLPLPASSSILASVCDSAPPVIPGYHSSPPTLPSQRLPTSFDHGRSGIPADPAHRIVNRAIDVSSRYGQRDRFLARIEAAAKELGMRIAKFDEYLRSPQGVVETQHAQDMDRHHSHHHSHCPQGPQAPEASMEDSFSSDAMS